MKKKVLLYRAGMSVDPSALEAAATALDAVIKNIDADVANALEGIKLFSTAVEGSSFAETATTELTKAKNRLDAARTKVEETKHKLNATAGVYKDLQTKANRNVFSEAGGSSTNGPAGNGGFQTVAHL